MDKPKGGRGKKAPYNSVTVRVPEDLKETVETLVNDYRQSVLEGTEIKSSAIPSIDNIKLLSKQLLKRRATRKEIVIKLVMGIYGVTLTDEDLL